MRVYWINGLHFQPESDEDGEVLKHLEACFRALGFTRGKPEYGKIPRHTRSSVEVPVEPSPLAGVGDRGDDEAVTGSTADGGTNASSLAERSAMPQT